LTGLMDKSRMKLDTQFGSIIRFVLNVGITNIGFGSFWQGKIKQ